MRKWLLVVAILAGSCAAQPKSAFEARDLKHNEILSWDQDIRGWRGNLGLSLQPDAKTILLFHDRPVDRVPPPEPKAATGDVCLDVCDLAGKICEAQEHICRIAGELGAEDEWAAEKCDSAKASCKEAKQRCEKCLQEN